MTPNHTTLMDTNTDSRLAATITDSIFKRGLLNSNAIDVSVREGIVTLRGWTNTFYQRQVIVQTAQRVAGVRALVDLIAVQPNNPHRPERLPLLR